MSNEINVEKLKMEIDEIKEKLDNIPTRDEMRLSNEKLIQRVLEQADDRYASKAVEKIVYTGVGAALLWMLNQILALL